MKAAILAATVLALCAAFAAAQGGPFGGGGPGGGGPFGGGPGGGGNSYNNGGSSSSSSSSSSGSSSSGSSSSGSQCRTGCCNTGNQVLKGSCASFSNYFNQGDSQTALYESSSAFQTRVNKAPTPSDACCTVARSFVSSGCSCNQQLKDAASQQGFSNSAVAVIARAVQASICSNSAHGGSISSGGC